MSRRALFGLGLERLRERASAVPDLPPPPPTLAEVRERWAVHAAAPSPLWRPVVERLVAIAGPAPTERVLAHGGCADLAAADGADVTALEGDPSRTMFDDGAFDVVLSAFGPQVTPSALAALAELGRLVAPGGRLVLAVWSGGAVARMLRTAQRLDPLPERRPSAAHWGKDERLRQDLWRFVAEPDFERFEIELGFPSAAEALDALRAALPPLAALGPQADGEALAADVAPDLRDRPGHVALTVPCLVARAAKAPR